ncbi:MAG: prepilin-type N-terminal cleavage/methylation domain-containing protein [Verrucomicrobiota bacterium]
MKVFNFPTPTPKTAMPKHSAFTLVELITSMAIFSVMLLILTSMTGTVINTWTASETKVDTVQNARGALELITREMTPAVIDTRMQYVIMPGDAFVRDGSLAGVNIVEDAQVALWMAPLGEDGELRCVGYYLARDESSELYQLKRIFVPEEDEDGDPHAAFPLMRVVGTASRVRRTSPTNADFFLEGFNRRAFNENSRNSSRLIVSTVADYVVAFWVQAIDILGNEIQWVSNSRVHPGTRLHYNSAAFFHAATSTPFDDGSSFVYLSQTEQAMKGNRVPASVDITVATIDQVSLERGLVPPIQANIEDPRGFLDIEESVRLYMDELEELGFKNARSFSTRVKLLNGS